MSIDTIGDFLTIIRNGIMASKHAVLIPHSTLKLSVGNILLQEGFISECSVVDAEATKKSIKIVLKYVDGESVIHELKRASKPGRRYYAGLNEIKPVIGGLGVSVLSTNRGVITNKEAKKLGIGGEVICTVW